VRARHKRAISVAEPVVPEFQRIYTPTAFREERNIWRAVIQLNLVRSIRTILDTVHSVLRGRSSRVNSGGEEEEEDQEDSLGPLDDVRALVSRLAPVRHIEAVLIAKLVPPHEDEATRRSEDEVFVRPGAGWKGSLARGVRPGSGHRPASLGDTGMETRDEITVGLHACRREMIALWQNPQVREILRRRKVRLEEGPGL
jgi:hypothetical protein